MIGPMARSAATAHEDPVTGSIVYPLGSTVNAEGHVAGRRLRPRRGRPRVRDSGLRLRARQRAARARSYVEALAVRGVDPEVLCASKAAPITALYRILREEGLVDVASGGELHMALGAGFDHSRIYMHGNNKSAAS